jgi:hypothetical protein
VVSLCISPQDDWVEFAATHDRTVIVEIIAVS